MVTFGLGSPIVISYLPESKDILVVYALDEETPKGGRISLEDFVRQLEIPEDEFWNLALTKRWERKNAS